MFLLEREETGERFALLKRKDQESKVNAIAVAGPVDRSLIEENGKLTSDWFTCIEDNYEFQYDELAIRQVVSKPCKNTTKVIAPPLGAHFQAYLERLNRIRSSLAIFGWDSDELEDDLGAPPGGRI